MRRNDTSTDPARWTHAKLLRELRSKANLETFRTFATGDGGDRIRKSTRLYRETWLAPLLDEVERRLVGAKPASKAPERGYVIRDLGTPPDRMAYVLVYGHTAKLPGRWVTRKEATRFATVHQAEDFAASAFGDDADITIEKAD